MKQHSKNKRMFLLRISLIILIVNFVFAYLGGTLDNSIFITVSLVLCLVTIILILLARR